MAEPIPLQEARKAQGKGVDQSRSMDPDHKDVVTRVAEINREYALVLVGDKALILRETKDFQGKDVVVFLTISAFMAMMEKERVWDAEDNRISSIGSLWKKHPDRRDYDGVIFAPEKQSGGDGRWFNYWRGFAVEEATYYVDPRDHVKHFRTFYDHILNNVACGNEEWAKWIWGWFAHMIQHPTERIGTALVLKGRQGTGKSKPGEIVGSLLGPHWVLIDDPKHLVGSFNAHMVSCLMLQADEGFWAGDKTAEGRLKSLITSNIHLIEKKGVDAIPVRNLIRLMVTSNNDWVIPAGLEERRFAVFHVSDNRMQDHAYFKQIDREMDDGGRQHLLSYLRRFDLSKVDVRSIPKTEALFEQKLASMPDLYQWWYDRLGTGCQVGERGKWSDEVATDRFFMSYLKWMDRMKRNRPLAKSQWSINLRTLLPRPLKDGQKVYVDCYDTEGIPIKLHDGSVKQERVNGFKLFPPLDECRAHFSKMLNHEIRWEEDTVSTEQNAAETPLSAGRKSGEESAVNFPVDDGIPEL